MLVITCCNLAETLDQAISAAEKISVDYDTLPAIIDVKAALDAPKSTRNAQQYVF